MALNDDRFPEMFQISVKWILDSSASKHFCGKDQAAAFKEHIRTVKATRVSTAAGSVVMNQAIIAKFGELDVKQEVKILPDSPALMSMGQIVQEGYSFYWNYGHMPCLVSANSSRVFVLDTIGGLPMIVKGGIFDK